MPRNWIMTIPCSYSRAIGQWDPVLCVNPCSQAGLLAWCDRLIALTHWLQRLSIWLDLQRTCRHRRHHMLTPLMRVHIAARLAPQIKLLLSLHLTLLPQPSLAMPHRICAYLAAVTAPGVGVKWFAAAFMENGSTLNVYGFPNMNVPGFGLATTVEQSLRT